MQIGIITDIHGNAPALRAVLNEFDKTIGVDHIYCLGDMIGIGPDSNEVLDMLFSRNDISMITGNHDEAILSLATGQEYPESHSHVREHHQWILDRIDKAYLPKLFSLPRLIEKNFDGTQMLFIHYQISKNKMSEPISKDPFSSIVEPSLENFQILFNDRNDDVICFGHHHPLHYFKGNNRVFLNPGSLGCNNKSTAPYAVITLLGEKVGINLAEAKYDNTDFLESYHRLKVPDRDIILKVFHGNQI
ncbi:fructose-bisphosphatase class III [Pradoshia sp. D12]|uniref:metallophosphoesterase family protein n=1 Tax=Bacillaceae TaxID=186817 RepID=UPI00112CA8A0|nr:MULTISPECIES: metallophosphoesterase family protein [Bacillaceae]QFK72376.1 fructose-bisphosphatase class III [Pradoshia sp. D12]TPF71130.1 metallophosphoesterase family protein [Bacillus sp. D12]